MKPRVYIETTIASAYHETRSDLATVERRCRTREWWDTQSMAYQCVSSEAVYRELSQGEYPHQKLAIEFIRELLFLDITVEVDEIVLTYINNYLMPDDPGGDAIHLAIASFHNCDFLVTWNCRHLANPNKVEHLRQINAKLGLFVPRLMTPDDLL